jgi:hypothetical protein
MSALPLKADVDWRYGHVRLVPKAVMSRCSESQASTSTTCLTGTAGRFHDAADDNAVGEHVKIVMVPLARGTAC